MGERINIQDFLVTVALPVYNGENFLKEALAKVINQTHENLEIIVFNDCSTDSTLDIIRSFSDSRIIIINSTKNYGPGIGTQVLKTLASGDFFGIISHDDLYLPNSIECLLRHAVLSNADLIFGVCQLMSQDGELLNAYIRVPDKVAKEKHFTRLFERGGVFARLISKKCYTSVDFDSTLLDDFGYDFTLKCSYKGYTFSAVDEVTYYYRQTKGSWGSKFERAYSSHKKILKKYPTKNLVKLYQEREFSDSNINYMLSMQYIFREDYKNALIHAKKKWPLEDDVDQDFYLGTLYLHNNELSNAETHLANHLSEIPESPAGHNNMGVLYRLINKDGSHFFKKAIELFPPYNDAKANIENPDNVIITDSQIEVVSDENKGFYGT